MSVIPTLGIQTDERTVGDMPYLIILTQRRDGKWRWSITGSGFTLSDVAESEADAQAAILKVFEQKKGGAA